MKRKSPGRKTRGSPVAFADPAVAAAFDAYPAPLRSKLLALRQLIFATAEATTGVGALRETLKWGQPSYLTPETNSGTTVRIDQLQSDGGYAVFFHCQTDLIETFRAQFGDQLRFDGNRAILFERDKAPPAAILRRCIAQALTYHLRKKRR